MEQIIEIDLDKIILNPNQPRKEFDKIKLKELADSIKNNGLINPIQVKQNKDDKNKFNLICGERRLKAHEIAKLKKIKAILKSYNSEEDEMAESLIENLHRTNLNSVEKENFIYELWKTGKYKTKKDLGKALGMISDDYISTILSAKEIRDKIKIFSKDITTRAISDTYPLPNLNDKNIILKKVEKKEIAKKDIRYYSKVFSKSNNDVKNALLKNKINFKQAEQINKIDSQAVRKQMITAHSEIKKIDKSIERNIKQQTKKPQQKLIDMNLKINNFRFSALETQNQLNITLKNLITCFKDINLMDNKNLNRFKHFQELFEMNISNCLEMIETFKKKDNLIITY